MSTKLPALYQLPIPHACRLKHEIGCQEHRRTSDSPFQGDPLIECYSEFIDALNYLDEAQRQGIDVSEMRPDVERLTAALQLYLCVTNGVSYGQGFNQADGE
jgi:hypothetical protein